MKINKGRPKFDKKCEIKHVPNFRLPQIEGSRKTNEKLIDLQALTVLNIFSAKNKRKWLIRCYPRLQNGQN